MKLIDMYGVIRYQDANHRLHRENGPAIIFPDGDSSWFFDGKLHRINGPAIDWKVEGRFVWALHGVRVDCTTQEEFEQLMRMKAFW